MNKEEKTNCQKIDIDDLYTSEEWKQVLEWDVFDDSIIDKAKKMSKEELLQTIKIVRCVVHSNLVWIYNPESCKGRRDYVEAERSIEQQRKLVDILFGDSLVQIIDYLDELDDLWKNQEWDELHKIGHLDDEGLELTKMMKADREAEEAKRSKLETAETPVTGEQSVESNSMDDKPGFDFLKELEGL